MIINYGNFSASYQNEQVIIAEHINANFSVANGKYIFDTRTKSMTVNKNGRIVINDVTMRNCSYTSKKLWRELWDTVMDFIEGCNGLLQKGIISDKIVEKLVKFLENTKKEIDNSKRSPNNPFSHNPADLSFRKNTKEFSKAIRK